MPFAGPTVSCTCIHKGTAPFSHNHTKPRAETRAFYVLHFRGPSSSRSFIHNSKCRMCIVPVGVIRHRNLHIHPSCGHVLSTSRTHYTVFPGGSIQRHSSWATLLGRACVMCYMTQTGHSKTLQHAGCTSWLRTVGHARTYRALADAGR